MLRGVKSARNQEKNSTIVYSKYRGEGEREKEREGEEGKQGRREGGREREKKDGKGWVEREEGRMEGKGRW